MDLVSIFALAAASSADCFIIGFNYGVKGVRIGNVSNGFIALVCFCGTFLSMAVGRGIGSLLNADWGSLLGGGLFVLLGGYMLWGALSPQKRTVPPRRHYSENPEMVDKDSSKVIELRESLLIGLLLCLNNIGVGVGAGMAGMPILSAPVMCALLSFLLIGSGHVAGRRITNPRLAGILEVLSGLLVLLLGLWELLPLGG